jgi:hypothetical protein
MSGATGGGVVDAHATDARDIAATIARGRGRHPDEVDLGMARSSISSAT